MGSDEEHKGLAEKVMRMERSRRRYEAAKFVLILITAISMVAMLVFQVVTNTNHRESSQNDHDCIVALALILGDPGRNRELPPDLPDGCRGAPALPKDADRTTDK